MNAERSIALILSLALAVADAAQTLESSYRTNGPSVQAAFESVRGVLQTSSAVFQRGRDEVVYGTVISPEGHILTKASELGEIEGLSVVVDNKVYRQPLKLAEDPAWDVALVKIDAAGLTPVSLAVDATEPERGTWVVANGATSLTRRRPQVGIVAANAREILPEGGAVLGLNFERKGRKLVVSEVHPGSGAEAAGVLAGDLLALLDGEAIATPEVLKEIIGKHRVGDEIVLSVVRRKKPLDLKIRLKGRSDVFERELSRNDIMSGDFSERRSGFPRVIQHDIMANAAGMGGPLLDLDGRCLGMNIARASRCETFAIPAGELRGVADRLLEQASGK